MKKYKGEGNGKIEKSLKKENIMIKKKKDKRRKNEYRKGKKKIN